MILSPSTNTSPQFCQEGKDGFIDWSLKSDNMFIFEIPIDRVKPFLPKGLNAIEIRPGIGLCMVAISRFNKNCLGFLPEFTEPNFSICVQNDLSKRDPTGEGRIPQFSFFMVSVTANNEDFLTHTQCVDKMPIYRSRNLVIESDGFDVKVKDDNGPIVDLYFSYENFDVALFEKNEWFIQVYSSSEGKLYYDPVLWSGKSFEHQKQDNKSRFYDHPFFQGLKVSDITSCYLQAISIDNEALFRFYSPVIIRSF